MHLVARHATHDDFPTVAALCPSRGDSIEIRQQCWDMLWQHTHPFGIVLTDYAPRERKDVSILVGAFVHESHTTRMATSEEPGACKLALMAHMEGESPFVLPGQIGSLNAGHGLNLMMTHVGWSYRNHHRAPAASVRAISWGALLDRHGGHKLQSIFGEATGVAASNIAQRAGWKLLNSYDNWAAAHDIDDTCRPFLVGCFRDDGLGAESPWLTRLFTYFPPRFHFTDHQRQILLLAREGYTDNEIAHIIGARAEAIKKRWSGIYDRVQEVFPDVLPSGGTSGRGAEKRRALLAHLRDRPEELRPFSRRATRARR